MSLGRLYYRRCDACGCPSGGVDELSETTRQAVAVARRLGWTQEKGRDICPDCRAKGWQVRDWVGHPERKDASVWGVSE